MAIRFPLTDLLNEQACYDHWLDTRPPESFLPCEQKPHDSRRAPIVKYQAKR